MYVIRYILLAMLDVVHDNEALICLKGGNILKDILCKCISLSDIDFLSSK